MVSGSGWLPGWNAVEIDTTSLVSSIEDGSIVLIESAALAAVRP
jgi:hypothetical protein